MQKLSWVRMLRDKGPGHLVVGREATASRGKAADRRAAHWEQLIANLVAKLNPAGDWSAITLHDPDGCVAVHTMFELKSDADNLADAVRARPTDRYIWVGFSPCLCDVDGRQAADRSRNGFE